MFLEIEIPHHTLEKSFDAAFVKLQKKAKVAGFRPGKVPRAIFEKNYGKSVLIQEGVSIAMNQAYLEAIRSEKLDVVDYPQNINTNEYQENQSVTFTCDVTVKPKLKLGKYKGIKIELKSNPDVNDQIESQIHQLREQMATYTTVSREIQTDDIVRANVNAMSEGQSIETWTRDNMAIKVGSSHLGKECDDALVGMKASEKKSFTIAYDAEFSNKAVAGKSVDFTLEVMEVREKSLPAVDDEFAKKVSDSDTLDQFKEKLTKQFESQNEKAKDDELRSTLLETLAKEVKVDLPEIMVKNEMKYDLEYYKDQINKAGSTFENYLQIMGKTQTEFEEELKEGVSKRIIGELILEEVAKCESITLDDSEKIEKVKSLVPTINTDDEARAHMKKINLNEFDAMLTKQKTMNFLINNAKIKS
jgi:trigger factor